jgi:hypothetical protein
MTYQQDFTLPVELLERVNKQGFDILPEAARRAVRKPGDG